MQTFPTFDFFRAVVLSCSREWKTALPKRDVSRLRLWPPATTDYWFNDIPGQPFLKVERPIDPGLLSARHTGGCILRTILHTFERAAACAVCAQAWPRRVRLQVIVGLPVEPRAGSESFSVQSPDRPRESR